MSRVCLIFPHFAMLPDRPVPDVSLAPCNKLEEVHARLLSNKTLTRSLISLLSSITSQRLRKVSLSFNEYMSEADSRLHQNSDDEWEDEDDEPELWSTLDMTLSRLAKQVSKVEGKLTLQLNFPCLDSEKVEFDHLLGQFLEYGELDINFTAFHPWLVSLRLLSLVPSNSSARPRLDSPFEGPWKVTVGNTSTRRSYASEFVG